MSFSDEADASIYHCKTCSPHVRWAETLRKHRERAMKSPDPLFTVILSLKLECIVNSQMIHCVSSEPEDRDMNCVVCSLVQVMCDPHCRTVAGFQGLVQKEWITAGHKFLSRINYHRESDKEEVKERENILFCNPHTYKISQNIWSWQDFFDDLKNVT